MVLSISENKIQEIGFNLIRMVFHCKMFIQNYFIRNIQIYFHATIRTTTNCQSATTCFWYIDSLNSGHNYLDTYFELTIIANRTKNEYFDFLQISKWIFKVCKICLFFFWTSLQFTVCSWLVLFRVVVLVFWPKIATMWNSPRKCDRANKIPNIFCAVKSILV